MSMRAWKSIGTRRSIIRALLKWRRRRGSSGPRPRQRSRRSTAVRMKRSCGVRRRFWMRTVSTGPTTYRPRIGPCLNPSNTSRSRIPGCSSPGHAATASFCRTWKSSRQSWHQDGQDATGRTSIIEPLSGVTCGLYGENREFRRCARSVFQDHRHRPLGHPSASKNPNTFSTHYSPAAHDPQPVSRPRPVRTEGLSSHLKAASSATSVRRTDRRPPGRRVR